MVHRIAVIGGDGIGPEVVEEALKVVRAAGVELDTTEFDLSGDRYLRDGTVLPDEVLDELRGFDAILLGAVGTPGVPPGVIERGLLLKMRFELDQYINLRPFTLPENDIDFVVIRENTRQYAGGGFLARDPVRVGHAGLGTPATLSTLHPLPSTWPGAARTHLSSCTNQRLNFSGGPGQRASTTRQASTPDSPPPTTIERPCIYFVHTRSATTWSSQTTFATSSPTSVARVRSASLRRLRHLAPTRQNPSCSRVHGSAPYIAGRKRPPDRRHPFRRPVSTILATPTRPSASASVCRTTELTASTPNRTTAVAGRL